MNIGVLALQGDFHEHLSCFNQLHIKATPVKSEVEVNKIDAIVIPGGESTTISKLLKSTNLDKLIIKKSSEGMPIWGTCAGLIMISNNLLEGNPEPLGLLNIKTSRNYYGRQIDSFVEDIKFNSEKNSFEAIFIRAPAILEIGENVRTVAKTSNNIPVAVRQKNIFGTSFHPELTNDLRIHKYFSEMIDK